MEKGVYKIQNSGLVPRLKTYLQIFLHLSLSQILDSPSCQNNPALQETARKRKSPPQIVLRCILDFISTNLFLFVFLFSFPGLESQGVYLSRTVTTSTKSSFFRTLGQLQRSLGPEAYSTCNVYFGFLHCVFYIVV